MEEKIVHCYAELNHELIRNVYNSISVYAESGECSRTLELENRCIGLKIAIEIYKEIFGDVIKEALS